MDMFDIGFYPRSIMAYPDALRRAPSTRERPYYSEAWMYIDSPQPVPSVTAARPKAIEQSRVSRLRRETPQERYAPYALSFDSVLSRYRRI